MPNTTEPTICCSFCGRPAEQVPRIITGYTAHICSDCVDACKELVRQHTDRALATLKHFENPEFCAQLAETLANRSY